MPSSTKSRRPPSRRRPTGNRRRRTGAIAALAATAFAIAAVAWLVTRGGDGPEATAESFLAAWSRGDDAGAARLTDDPRRAAEDLEANRRGLDGASVRARMLDVSEDGDAALAPM